MKYFVLMALLSSAAMAQNLTDSERDNALHDTQALLRNKADRQKAIDGDAHAKDTDNKVTALVGGGKNKEDMYELSAQLMEKLTTESKGDPAEMQKLLLEAQKNPQSFYEKYMNDSQKAKVTDLAKKIDKSGTTVPASK